MTEFPHRDMSPPTKFDLSPSMNGAEFCLQLSLDLLTDHGSLASRQSIERLTPMPEDALPKPADRTSGPTPTAAALFVDDRELHRRVCPSLGWDSFRAVVKVWERDGFPKIIPLTRGRFYPAVEAWLNAHYGLCENMRSDIDLKSDEFSSVFLRRLRFEDGRRPIAL